MSNELSRDALRRLRLSLNLTQEEFGRLINASTWTISRWENGVAIPDVWQHDVLVQMSVGLKASPELSVFVGRFVRTGRVGLALGALLGAAVRKAETE